MYIRAHMNSYLDKTVGKLDTIAAELLRVWKVTGTDEAIEAFRSAVGGVVIPNEDIVGVLDAAVVAKQVKEKTVQVAELQASLDVATVELEDMQKMVTAPVTEKLAKATIDKALPIGGYDE